MNNGQIGSGGFLPRKLDRITFSIIVLFLVFAVFSFICLKILTNSGSVKATINGNAISWFKNPDKALSNVSLNIYGDTVIKFNESEYKISVEITGQTSGICYTADNRDGVSGWLNSFKHFIGISNVDVEENTFKFNSDDFQAGEILLIRVEFDKSKNLFDQTDDNLSYRYYAVMVQNAITEQSQLAS